MRERERKNERRKNKKKKKEEKKSLVKDSFKIIFVRCKKQKQYYDDY